MLFNVQALRAVATLLVVLVHLEVLSRIAGLPQGATVFGNSGVDLFFVISGVIMVVTTAQRAQNSQEFLRNRITRIVPLYWLVTLGVTAIAIVAPTLLQATNVTPLIVKSLAFVPYQRADGAMEPVVFVGRTLNYEMAFYAIFAVGLLLPRMLGLVFTLLVLSLAAIAAQLFQFSDPILSFYTAPIAIEFGFGIVLGMVFVSDRLPRSPRWRLPAAAIAFLAFAIMVAGPWLWRDTDRAVIFGIPAFVIVGCALIAERGGLALRSRWIQLLGAASYAIYLTHFFSTQIVVKLAEHLTHFGAPMMIALGLLAFALVIFVGIAVHKNIELPLTALARGASRERRQRMPNPQASANTALAEPASELLSYASLPAEPTPALTPAE